MSVFRLFESSPPDDIVSVDGDFSNPDDESSLDGTNGETSQKKLYVALCQTTLNGGIDDSQTEIEVSAANFANTNYPVILIGSEKLLITAGFGTTTLTVTRGYNNTTAAAHDDGTAVYACYSLTNCSIDCEDNTGTDESGWMTYCDDDGGNPNESWEAPHSLDDVDPGDTLTIWRKLVVPASTSASFKQDLIHRLSCSVEEYNP